MGVIILAGGKSRRMGTDKALLLYEGVSLLERVLAVACALDPEVAIVTETPERYALTKARQIPDRFPGEGPLGGLITGLEALGRGTHFALACDMPLLRVEVLQAILERSRTEYDAVVPVIGGRAEPLCAVYRDSALAPLCACFERGERALHRALRGLQVLPVAEEDLRLLDPSLASFWNVNAPEDFRALP